MLDRRSYGHIPMFFLTRFGCKEPRKSMSKYEWILNKNIIHLCSGKHPTDFVPLAQASLPLFSVRFFCTRQQLPWGAVRRGVHVFRLDWCSWWHAAACSFSQSFYRTTRWFRSQIATCGSTTVCKHVCQRKFEEKKSKEITKCKSHFTVAECKEKKCLVINAVAELLKNWICCIWHQTLGDISGTRRHLTCWAELILASLTMQCFTRMKWK